MKPTCIFLWVQKIFHFLRPRWFLVLIFLLLYCRLWISRKKSQKYWKGVKFDENFCPRCLFIYLVIFILFYLFVYLFIVHCYELLQLASSLQLLLLLFCTVKSAIPSFRCLETVKLLQNDAPKLPHFEINILHWMVKWRLGKSSFFVRGCSQRNKCLYLEFSGPYFPAFGINMDQKNSEYRHILRSGCNVFII